MKTNVRIISATNRDLEGSHQRQAVPKDPYYGLNMFPIRVPRLLREGRKIPALVQYFIKKYNDKFGIKRDITEDAVEYLKGRDWPAAIRELENMVQRLLISPKARPLRSLT